MKTSEQLIQGRVYTRNQLSKMFKITDSTIKNGIFKPREYDSIWLFITENKASDRTKYNDRLINNILDMDGQTNGRTDDLIITHLQKGLELVLFYRDNKYQYKEYGFRFEGIFNYVLHEGFRPTHFILQRDNGIDEISNRDLETIYQEEGNREAFFEGGIKQRTMDFHERNPKLRTLAIQYHGTRCMICGFSFEEFYGTHGNGYIEVHHLKPISGFSNRETVDPFKDMIVVCANCHRMIHRKKGTTLSPDVLKGIIINDIKHLQNPE